jgi:hypothetical protein
VSNEPARATYRLGEVGCLQFERPCTELLDDHDLIRLLAGLAEADTGALDERRRSETRALAGSVLEQLAHGWNAGHSAIGVAALEAWFGLAAQEAERATSATLPERWAAEPRPADRSLVARVLRDLDPEHAA